MLELPQVGSLADVFAVPGHVAAGATSDVALGGAYPGQRVDRQGRYLRLAAELLGLVKNVRGKNSMVLTAAGHAYLAASGREQSQMQREFLARFNSAQELLRIVQRRGNPETATVVADFPIARSTVKSQSTLNWRIPALLAWLVEVGLLHISATSPDRRYSLTPQGIAALGPPAAPPILPPPKGAARKSPGRVVDVVRRSAIEKAAIDAATSHYVNLGYDVVSREAENLGWDLDVTAIGVPGGLKIEVKGTSLAAFAVELSRNEYEKMNLHQESYRIVIVTNALGSPFLREFVYESKTRRWLDPVDGRVLTIRPVTAAILT
jgi:hypothetical protein